MATWASSARVHSRKEDPRSLDNGSDLAVRVSFTHIVDRLSKYRKLAAVCNESIIDVIYLHADNWVFLNNPVNFGRIH